MANSGENIHLQQVSILKTSIANELYLIGCIVLLGNEKFKSICFGYFVLILVE